ncbi:MAG: hypothetical protein MRT15_04075 [archaeon YNP-LCB-003-016]|uniref:hypothetical protein n=1 Tax=Candidatus Culexarchaeum yellowstonense TaxID=2928963 RepID=UPI0026F3764C|nr:hypothetical protein [Candidatus Culexarchaeum yellowstonense]MCR6691545.1 hypothetical protein [Candidatus Culexarchaeum yellowstonense]
MSSTPSMGSPAPNKRSGSSSGPEAGDWGVREYKDIYEMLLDRGIRFVKKGNKLLLYKKFPCHCEEPFGHIHYYIVSLDEYPEDNPWKLKSLLNWLDYGFWNDSFIAATLQGYETLVQRFMGYKCPGALQNL